ncbi:tRNA lysidine(34) synthetase TilS [Streptococcus oriscaviae]|uniref:tRNA(Ile)-lysidine synthase n=1 Tax=Streptococcus oriscaviae TaxID=2781599 RepID=A0ABX7YIT4_9STRE|nr:tRNA lysidine(34) synthetase TilS [Streptococcus oriscaviae]QUE53618.1 tRNA lysidine(34) synthetase TilS [Streptococcus oriscaviae]
MMNNRFLKVAQDGHFFDKHKKVLVAVSGGKDSMNLLHLLFRLQKELEINLGLVHVNHKQRPEADQEEEYLRNWAREQELPFYSTAFTDSFSEQKARKFRYQFFQKVMQEEGYSALVTAHHADDQAETIFMRLLRGSRWMHLSGIQAVQKFADGELIRPLLSFSKTELEDLFHFEDESNDSLIYFRNRVRHAYLPLMQQENPQFSKQLLEFGKEQHLLHQALLDLSAGIDLTNLQVFRQQTEAVQYVLLQLYLEKFPDLQLSKSQFDMVMAILRTKANYRHKLKSGYYLIKDYERFSITKILPQTDTFSESYMIKSEGIVEIGRFLVSLNQPLEGAQQVINLEPDKPILIRKRQAGDTILLHQVNKKLRRLFIDKKISQTRREEPIVVEQDGKIYGILDIAISDLSKSLKNDIIKATLYIKMKE